MKNWYQVHEQSASKIRLETLWIVYKMFGIRFLKIVLLVICLFIVPFAKPARNASKKYIQILNKYQQKHGFKKTKISTFSHIYTFACTILDKMVANCDSNARIQFIIEQNDDWSVFQKYLNSNIGVFLICSHLGNIEVLSAFDAGKTKKMHAFMQVSQNSVFHKFMMRHNIAKNTNIYPTENIDIGTASNMYDNLKKGDLVMMAGDRTSKNAPTKCETVQFLDTNCNFPLGTFKFAKSLSHPIFTICVMKTSNEKYNIYIRQIKSNTTKEMVEEYADFLENLVIKYPKQWFNFFDFFITQ